MNFKFTIFSIFFCISSAAVAAPAPAPADELAQLLNNSHTMQASVKQYMVNEKRMKIGQETIAAMMLERPGKFRWEVTKPSKQLIILNKNKLILYDVDLAQVTKRSVDYKNPGNPAMLLSGNTNTLKQMFKITKLKSVGKGIGFELQPKGKNSDYKWLKMFFVSGKLNAMYILDSLGQQNEIYFYNIKLNSKLSENKFDFVVPPKVDVLDEG
jgi:outer membrane lipoprotein carrier protein